MISEKLQELTKSKFSNHDCDFTGPSDPSAAPAEMRIVTNDASEIFVKGVLSEDVGCEPEVTLNKSV